MRVGAAGGFVEDRNLPFVVGALVAWTVIASCFAAIYMPTPSGDWAYYWKLATDLGDYRRGGLSVFLLTPFKLLGLQPWMVALPINVGIAWTFVLLCSKVDDTPGKVPTLLAMLYLYTLVPFAGIVQVDMIAALWALAALLLGASAVQSAGRWRVGLAIGCLAMAASTRSQYALVLMVMALALFPFILFGSQRQQVLIRTAVLIIGLGGMLGLVLDTGMRSGTGNGGTFRTGVGVVIYSGLLVTPSSGPWCGGWTPEAKLASELDDGLPFIEAMSNRVSARSFDEFMETIGCKTGRILGYEPFAWYWLQNGRGARRDDELGEARWQWLDRWAPAYDRYFAVVRSLGWACLACFVLLSVHRRHLLGIVLPLAWIFSYWAVHAVFEVQGRYFLGMAWLAPVLSFVAYRQWREVGSDERAQ